MKHHSIQMALASAAAVIAIEGCRTANPKPTSEVLGSDVVDSNDLVPPYFCTAGSPIAFSLTLPTGEEADPALVGYESPMPGVQFQVGRAGDWGDVRFDLCELNDEMTLHRVVVKGIFPMFPEQRAVFTPGPDALIEGLNSTVFGDYGALQIYIPNGASDNVNFKPNEGLLVRGWQVDERQIVTATIGRRAGGSFEPAVTYAIAGNLEVGDRLAPNGCGAGGATSEQWNVRAGSAVIALKVCSGGVNGTVGTRIYEIYEATVKDTSDSLPEVARGQSFAWKRGEPQPGHEFVQKIQHHNICDSLYLKVPHAEYALNFGPGGVSENFPECSGEMAPNAPKKEPGQPDFFKAEYNVRYGNKPWTRGVATLVSSPE